MKVKPTEREALENAQVRRLVQWIEERWNQDVIVTYVPRRGLSRPIRFPVSAATYEAFSIFSTEEGIKPVRWNDVRILEVTCLNTGESITTEEFMKMLMEPLPSVIKALTPRQLRLN